MHISKLICFIKLIHEERDYEFVWLLNGTERKLSPERIFKLKRAHN